MGMRSTKGKSGSRESVNSVLFGVRIPGTQMYPVFQNSLVTGRKLSHLRFEDVYNLRWEMVNPH